MSLVDPEVWSGPVEAVRSQWWCVCASCRVPLFSWDTGIEEFCKCPCRMQGISRTKNQLWQMSGKGITEGACILFRPDLNKSVSDTKIRWSENLTADGLLNDIRNYGSGCDSSHVDIFFKCPCFSDVVCYFLYFVYIQLLIFCFKNDGSVNYLTFNLLLSLSWFKEAFKTERFILNAVIQ